MYFDTVRGKQIHPDQLQGYIARHRYDSFGTPTKPVKAKKAKVKPVEKPDKPKSVVAKKTNTDKKKPEPFKAGVIRDVTKEWMTKRKK